jgi:hypothetical protein
VLHQNGAGVAHRIEDADAREIVDTGKHDRQSSRPTPQTSQEPIRTWLTGSECPRPPTSWWEMTNDYHKHHLFNERERGFLNNISRLRRPPTDRQLAWLEAIYMRLHEREVAA